MNGKISAIKFVAVGLIALSNLFNASAQQSKKFKTRCGWLNNPTTATYSLSDKDRQWTIGAQGDYQVKAFERPAFKRGQ